MTLRLVSSLSAFKSFAEILPVKIGMAYGNSSKNHMAS